MCVLWGPPGSPPRSSCTDCAWGSAACGSHAPPGTAGTDPPGRPADGTPGGRIMMMMRMIMMMIMKQIWDWSRWVKCIHTPLLSVSPLAPSCPACPSGAAVCPPPGPGPGPARRPSAPPSSCRTPPPSASRATAAASVPWSDLADALKWEIWRWCYNAVMVLWYRIVN